MSNLIYAASLSVLVFNLAVQASHAGGNFCRQQENIRTQGQPDRILCKSDGFEVDLPSGWTSKADASAKSQDSIGKEVSNGVALHFVSANTISNGDVWTGGNCPIVSMINIDAKKSLEQLVKSVSLERGSFWFAVFDAAGFIGDGRVFGGSVLNFKQLARRDEETKKWPNGNDILRWRDQNPFKASWNDNWTYEPGDGWIKQTGAMYSMVEVIFQTRTDGPVLRARQAIYYIPGTVKSPAEPPSTKDSKFVHDRVYFVNCTALDRPVDRKPEGKIDFTNMGNSCSKGTGFCKELNVFNQIIKSLTPRRCYEEHPSNDWTCIPQNALIRSQNALTSKLLESPLGESAGENVSLAQSQELIAAGALVAKMGVGEQ